MPKEASIEEKSPSKPEGVYRPERKTQNAQRIFQLKKKSPPSKRKESLAPKRKAEYPKKLRVKNRQQSLDTLLSPKRRSTTSVGSAKV
ncbi:hypothetical protein TNIN_158751 [Trichonephila inaurata madagascariensis]|uniref:Uncharacterized protein n=1 Tax=Trichonephila inaurata madagascariensis TaxID=2747483 RepID=A0A8X7BR76_9ARAC|nr:hypothetical protein TNIN_158751 [Trichonephila inaurata madagascariensis]